VVPPAPPNAAGEVIPWLLGETVLAKAVNVGLYNRCVARPLGQGGSMVSLTPRPVRKPLPSATGTRRPTTMWARPW